MSTVQCDGLVVTTLASGSKGNCTYVGDDRSGVLIDCGLSTRQTLTRLEAVGLGEVRIEAVLVTHEHTDHVGAAAVLDRRLQARQGAPVPFYVTRGTAGQLSDKVRPRHLVPVRAGDVVTLGALSCAPHAVPHDVREPVVWTVTRDGVQAGVITDLGHAPRLVTRLLSELDVAVVEFNHDPQMLLDGPYPWALKQRIRGRHGHLSNVQAAELLHDGASSRLRHVVLAHLSEDNNTPEVALEAAVQALEAAGRDGVVVEVAAQRTPCDPIRVGPRALPMAAAPAQPTLFDA